MAQPLLLSDNLFEMGVGFLERVAFVLRIREKDQQEYIKRHQAVYPELLRAFEDVGIKTYSIFMDGGTLSISL